MKTYVTFGQVHAHSVNGKTFDKDCVAEIEAPSEADARVLAFDCFGGKFCFTYPDKPPDMSYFPRGIIPLNHKEGDENDQ